MKHLSLRFEFPNSVKKKKILGAHINLQIALFKFFFKLNNVQLCICITICISIHLLMTVLIPFPSYCGLSINEHCRIIILYSIKMCFSH